MELLNVQGSQWEEVREIYLEAFPKRERKPFGMLKRGAARGKLEVLAAVEEHQLLGFTVLIPYNETVMVDYLAVSGAVRSHGTGSRILQAVLERFAGQRVMLLIEALDPQAENYAQRQARRRFYLKNNFTSSGVFPDGKSGKMELLNAGGTVSSAEYVAMMRYALGPVLFALSGIHA